MKPPRYWKPMPQGTPDEVAAALLEAIQAVRARQRNRSALGLLYLHNRAGYRIVRQGAAAWQQYSATPMLVLCAYCRAPLTVAQVREALERSEKAQKELSFNQRLSLDVAQCIAKDVARSKRK